MEINLAIRFQWSLLDIEETDVLAIFPFMKRLMTREKDPEPRAVEAFCDEVDFF